MSEYERRRIDAEIKADRPEREHYCRTCNATVVSKGIPSGWYSLKSIPGGEGPKQNGLYCSVPCLAATVHDMEARL